mgnify:CR=1 FL=1
MQDLRKVPPSVRQVILNILNQLHPSDAIQLIESIGKELRQKNSIRISKKIPVNFIEMERPDLENLKP